jgi:MHS family proline/betaine transporter-like MFS transporter
VSGGAGTAAAEVPPSRRAVLAGSLGTIIEWYDFSLYVYLAPIYARVFFPGADGLDGVVATLGIFAVSYMARPVGAIAFGHYGDRAGRRSALLISASIMCVALLLNGLLPSSSTSSRSPTPGAAA